MAQFKQKTESRFSHKIKVNKWKYLFSVGLFGLFFGLFFGNIHKRRDES